MRFGLVTFVTEHTVRPDDLARAVEDLGFDSLFFTEHSNIPASRATPYPGGGDLPPEYYSTYDPFVALSWAAAATSQLNIGTGMCILVQRDPIHTAKAAASLDRLSNGRFLFGVSPGWNREEMLQHGTNPATRTPLLREKVLAIREMWANETAEFHGEYVNIEPTTVRPTPMQTPGPPVVLGGMGPTVIDRVLDYADAWAPNPGWPPMPDLPDRIVELRERSLGGGRPRVPVYLFGMEASPSQTESYAEMGVDECVFLLPSLNFEDTVTTLTAMAKDCLTG